MANHPTYPSKLKAKILQKTDDPQRAVRLVGERGLGLYGGGERLLKLAKPKIVY